MPILNLNLPFSIEHIHGQRCEVLNDYVFSNQLIIRELVISSPLHGSRTLNKLSLSCTPAFLIQLFEHRRDSVDEPELSIDFEAPFFWFHDYIKSEHALLATRWQFQFNANQTISFLLNKIIAFGHSPKAPFDLCCDYIEHAANRIAEEKPNPFFLSFDAENGEITADPLHILCACLIDDTVQIGFGKIYGWIEDRHFFFQFGADVTPPEETPQELPRKIQTGRFFSPPAKRSTILLDAPQETAPNRIKIEEIDLKCPAIRRIHRYVEKGEKISLETARHALREATDKLEANLKLCLLYMLHQWAPKLDEPLKLEILCAASDENDSPYPVSILKDCYRSQKNDAMLIAMIQQQIANNILAPIRRIPLEIEYSLILSGAMHMPTLAIKKLDAIKPLVQEYATPKERVEYALAYHKAQFTGRAMQFLREWLQSAFTPADIALYSIQLAKLMFEHNDPIQSIINVCSRVLEVDPQNVETLELLARCFEASNKPEQATIAWLQCFEQFIHTWEMARTKVGLSPSTQNFEWLQISHQKAIEAATTLEKLLEGPEKVTMRCLVYRSHLKLVPNSVQILARLLEDLESMHSFYEMAQVCHEFLKKNAQTIDPSNEISIRLTLHNLYDVELNRPEEALKQLNIARELAALDTRVIHTEIERCRRRGQKEEQIGLRIALIEALPPNEIVEPTLELVRLCESLNKPADDILDILRKTNARSPNHPQILLEMRAYLRKNNQLFELNAVLENLSHVISDLQMRKALLIEASEVNEKLGNKTQAQVLYHEAMLCSPINPEGDLTSQPLPFAASHSPHANANLASLILTSQSLPNLNSLDDLEATIIGNGEDSAISDAIDASKPRCLNEFSRAQNSYISIPTDFQKKPSVVSSKPFDENEQNDFEIDASLPIDSKINAARVLGNTRALLECLIASIQDIPEDERPPRVLQEIGCIYLYEKHDFENAKIYLEKASELSHDVEFGEQTLNALELIYQSMKLYRDLANVYEKKCQILTNHEERRKYEVRLAQLRYEQLGETSLAIETLQNILQRTPENGFALQQLAQIYLDTQDKPKAIETLEKMSSLYAIDSIERARHTLRLIALYSSIDDIPKVKTLIHELLENNTHIDKLAIIEVFKRACRERDEWQELLYILCDEIAYDLKIPRNKFSLDLVLDPQYAELASGKASHALREYADVLYQKLKSAEEAANIYYTLVMLHPETEYPRNVLFEIAEQSPHNASIIRKIVALSAPDMMEKISQIPWIDEEKQKALQLQNAFESAITLASQQRYEDAETVLSTLHRELPPNRVKFYTPILVALRQYVRQSA